MNRIREWKPLHASVGRGPRGRVPGEDHPTHLWPHERGRCQVDGKYNHHPDADRPGLVNRIAEHLRFPTAERVSSI